MRRYDDAEADLKRASELDDKDSAIPKLRERVRVLKQKQVDKEKKMYGKMFG